MVVSIDYLWRDQKFEKDIWGDINFLVGPNGTGKTLFAEKLREQLPKDKLSIRYIGAERLIGLEKRNYDYFGSSDINNKGYNIGHYTNYRNSAKNFGLSADAFVVLKERIDIRIKIEAILSQLFGKKIRFEEVGGFLKPKVIIPSVGEYDLKTKECNGLKELVPLLTFLYDDEFNCLIIDEPELHLHPQFQTFLLQEIRKLAGDPVTQPGKKCFFLITHSPYLVDFKTVNDLSHCIVFQPNKSPAYISDFSDDDEFKIKRWLPRLNTHHKQFFFASRPVFVEGYTDQQLFTLIQEKRGIFLGASGSCIIDVNGKDELDIFFRLCNKLNIDAQFICDLDALFEGNLRQSVSENEYCRDYLQNEGLGTKLLEPDGPIGKMQKRIDSCVSKIESQSDINESESNTQKFYEALEEANKIADPSRKLTKKRYIFSVSLYQIQNQIADLIPSISDDMQFINGRMTKIIEAFRQCGVHILSKGELENYLPCYSGSPYIIPNDTKSKVLQAESDFILSHELNESEFRSRYGELIDVLDESSSSTTVNIDLYINYEINEWIHKVQLAYRRDEISDKESLMTNPTVDWKIYSQILDLVEFTPNSSGFLCKAKLKATIDPKERTISFDGNQVPSNYELINN